VRLHDDEAADQLHAFLYMRNNFQPVLAPQIQMGLPGDERALRRARQELGEVALLPRHPSCALAQLGFYGPQRRVFRCRDDHRRIWLNSDLECLPRAADDFISDILLAVL